MNATIFDRWEGRIGLNPLVEIKFSRRNLPHWNCDDVIYWVTFRLADSLPAKVLEQLTEQ
ncbi:MAG TPA: hypothetical protein PJ991_07595 [Kiritimatiellia bacterium]|nr:hypothetical protein [Kiritimatiellia bacterium]